MMCWEHEYTHEERMIINVFPQRYDAFVNFL